MVLHHHSALSLSLIIRGAASRGVVSRHLLWVEGQGFAMAAQAGGEALVVPRWLPVRPGTSLADRNPTVLGLIRVIVLAAVLLDSTAILVEPRATWSALGDVAQTALGIVTIAAVLWTRWRPALAGALVLVAVVSVRGHETGVEVLVFMIALVVSVAVGTPRLAIGFALLSVVPVVLPTTAPGLDARLQGWALLGALSVMVGLLARAMLGWERSAAVQLASQREDTARARERVRGELAVDVGAVVTHALTTTERTLSALPPCACCSASSTRPPSSTSRPPGPRTRRRGHFGWRNGWGPSTPGEAVRPSPFSGRCPTRSRPMSSELEPWARCAS